MNEIEAVFKSSFGDLLTSSKVSFLYHENGFKKAAYNEKMALVPASNAKLFHTAAALKISDEKDVLQPLQINVNGSVSNGIVNGDLVIDACGSLFFSGRYPSSLSLHEKRQKLSDRVGEFIKQLKNAGLSTIQGDLKLTFDRWNGLQKNSQYNAATAFSYNENTVDTYVQDGNMHSCPESPLFLSFKEDKSIKAQDKRINNTIFYNPSKSSKDYWRVNAIDVNEYARSMLKRDLQKNGILFKNKEFSGKAKPLFELKSDETLAGFIYPINQYSDNLRAELLALLLNRSVTGSATYKGLNESLTMIFDKAVKGNYEIYDGSGLSRKNRASATSLVSLLEHMSNSDQHLSLEQSLSIASRTGTLAKRFHNSPFAGTFIGKTGTLNKVTALSGYWFKDEYTKVTLSFIGNGAENENYWQALEHFAKSLR